jgi:hypothetical protein
MKKHTIVIASVLKPVHDTRMFEKMACSLAKNPTYEVFVIGYGKGSSSGHPEVHWIGLGHFPRISWRRWAASLRVGWLVLQMRPSLFVIHTHELLGVSVWLRLLGIRTWYDVRENYFHNILYTSAFPKILRGPLACWVRLKEWILSPFISAFSLAEAGYMKEIPFLRKNSLILENKSMISPDFKPSKKPIGKSLLFSGTLAETTGVLQAIEWTKRLHGLDSSVHLRIIGYCAQASVLRQIKQSIAGFDFITLEGGDQLVSHSQIIKAIEEADFGWINYPITPVVEHTMPTKLYEYLSLGLPILLVSHAPWMDVCRPYQAAVIIEDQTQPFELLQQMNGQTFYIRYATNVHWASEESKLLDSVHALLG